MQANDLVLRVDHHPEGVAKASVHDVMRVVRVKGRYTDCVYVASGVHVSHPTHLLVPAPK
jgi:hypothetical protein